MERVKTRREKGSAAYLSSGREQKKTGNMQNRTFWVSRGGNGPL